MLHDLLAEKVETTTFGDATALGEYQIGRSIELQHAGEMTIDFAFQRNENSGMEVVHALIEPWFLWIGNEPLTGITGRLCDHAMRFGCLSG